MARWAACAWKPCVDAPSCKGRLHHAESWVRPCPFIATFHPTAIQCGGSPFVNLSHKVERNSLEMTNSLEITNSGAKTMVVLVENGLALRSGHPQIWSCYWLSSQSTSALTGPSPLPQAVPSPTTWVQSRLLPMTMKRRGTA